MSNEEIYILCMMFGNETEILGAFTDKRELIKAYDKLMNEDCRCLGSLIRGRPMRQEFPSVFKIPLNSFIGKKEEWCSEETFIFIDWINEYEVDINEVQNEIV